VRIRSYGVSSLLVAVLATLGCSPSPKAAASESEADRRMKETASDSAESRQPFGPNSPGVNTLGTGDNAVPLRKPGEPIDAPPPGKLPPGVSASPTNAKGKHASAEETQRANTTNAEPIPAQQDPAEAKGLQDTQPED
jgi:hypothetical protein